MIISIMGMHDKIPLVIRSCFFLIAINPQCAQERERERVVEKKTIFFYDEFIAMIRVSLMDGLSCGIISINNLPRISKIIL